MAGIPTWDEMTRSVSAASPRQLMVGAATALDALFLIFMAFAASGPLGLRSVYWGMYTEAQLGRDPRRGTFYAGVWGNCRRTGGLRLQQVTCSFWTSDPSVVPDILPAAFFDSLTALQVLSGAAAVLGFVLLAYRFDRVPLLACTAACLAMYLVVFAMTTWATLDLGNHLNSYDSYSSGPGMALGSVALILIVASTVLRALSLRASDGAPHARLDDEARVPMAETSSPGDHLPAAGPVAPPSAEFDADAVKGKIAAQMAAISASKLPSGNVFAEGEGEAEEEEEGKPMMG
ncbi:hypothetical protein DFJ74DRAFT_735364 [Hyaloraphidium curvatum]|nr:hypothetical protein DFJ74DRAFT_735364 [Hyaloraphidium curvatum]